jgi:ATP-binding cassette subfamily C protein LapB
MAGNWKFLVRARDYDITCCSMGKARAFPCGFARLAGVKSKHDADRRTSVTAGESDREVAASSDALLDCLLMVAHAHGGVYSRDALTAGLPLAAGRLTPSLFERAARRAGMASRIVAASLDDLNPALLPAILLLDEGGACVALERTPDAAQWRLAFPEAGESALVMSRTELEKSYSGRAIYARPRFRFDARAPAMKTSRRGHWFWSVIGENRRIYRDVMVAAFFINIFALAMPLFVRNVYDRVVPNNAMDTMWVLSVGVFIVLVAELALRTMRGYFVDLAGSRADMRLSAAIMEQVLGLRMEARPASAGALAANMRGFESVRDFISSATVTAFVDLPFALLFLAAIAVIAWPLAIPFAIGVSVLIVWSAVVQGKMHELAQISYRAANQRNATLVEGLVGAETIKALGAESEIQRKWESGSSVLAQMGTQLRLLASMTVNVANWAQHTVSLALMLIGVHLIGTGELSVGGLVACYILSGRAMAPFGRAAGLLMQYHNAATSLAAIDGLMQKEAERPDGANFITRRHFRGDIEFRELGFNYPNQEMATLRGVSFKIEAGEHVAILGRIGSGKTTLEKLILGLYRPTSGAVLIDGVDVRQLDPAELRRHIGYVPQDPTLFFGTLRDNIAWAMPLADDAAVIHAAELAGLGDFVNTHPRGFDMMVSERGESLSGGQRQCVALARALIRDPPILLLDEPTAAMDFSCEEKIRRRLAEYAVGKTLLVVTHRTPLLELAERVIVIDGGRIVADGPKAQVVEALRQGQVGIGRTGK